MISIGKILTAVFIERGRFMWTDHFVLKDKDGNVLKEKNKVEHLKVFLDEMGISDNDVYHIKSDVSGYEFEVTAKTTQEEWREYAKDCYMALD